MAKRKVEIVPASEKRTHRGCAQEIRRQLIANPDQSATAIAKDIGCTEGAVRSVVRNYLGENTLADVEEFQANEPTFLDVIRLRVLESLTPQKLQNARAAELATVYGIMFDKAALRRGQATGINVVALLDVVQAIRERSAGDSQGSHAVRTLQGVTSIESE